MSSYDTLLQHHILSPKGKRERVLFSPEQAGAGIGTFQIAPGYHPVYSFSLTVVRRKGQTTEGKKSDNNRKWQSGREKDH